MCVLSFISILIWCTPFILLWSISNYIDWSSNKLQILFAAELWIWMSLFNIWIMLTWCNKVITLRASNTLCLFVMGGNPQQLSIGYSLYYTPLDVYSKIVFSKLLAVTSEFLIRFLHALVVILGYTIKFNFIYSMQEMADKCLWYRLRSNGSIFVKFWKVVALKASILSKIEICQGEG